MKKALIVLENHFLLDKYGNVWSERIVDYNYLKRYLNVFDKIIVAGRCKEVDKVEVENLLVSGDNVTFLPLPEFIGAKGLIKNLWDIKKRIRNILEEIDCVIYRAPTHLSLFTYKEVVKSNKVLGLEFMMAANKMIEGDDFISVFLNRLIDKMAKKMVMSANGVSYVTQNILQKVYPCKSIVDGESNLHFTASYSSISLNIADYHRQQWNFEEKPNIFKIIHVGYMDSYRKGQDVLLQVIKKVKDQGYDVKLILIGDGNKKSEFEMLAKKLNIQDIVEFKGLIKDKQLILKYLRESHLLVFPTQSEGLPRTIIEAMSQGLPCISSPVDGIPELLGDDFLVPFDDIEGYTNKIIMLLNDWEKMIRISEQNYQKSKQYNSDILNKKRTQFYQKLSLVENENKN